MRNMPSTGSLLGVCAGKSCAIWFVGWPQRTRTIQGAAAPPSRRRVNVDNQTELVEVKELLAHPKNPRMGNTEAIASSIEDNGWWGTVVVQASTKHILAGNHRVMAAKQLGMKEVPVYWVDVDDDQALKILLADNRTTDLASYDDVVLAELLSNLDGENPLAGTGYDPESVTELLGDVSLPDWLTETDDDLPPVEDEPSILLAERFGAPPFSVLDTRQGYWRNRKQQWVALGIESEIGRSDDLLKMSDSVRRPGFFDQKAEMEKKAGRALTVGEVAEVLNEGLLTNSEGETEQFDNENAGMSSLLNTSLFDPVLCELVYRWWGVKGGTIVDPFAGGSVRGIVAGKLGYNYYGVELREEQVVANVEQGSRILGVGHSAQWVQGDSTSSESWKKAPKADLMFTCPPYADLEVYSDDPADLSNAETDDDFFGLLSEAFANADGCLKDNAFAVVVMGEVRDSKSSALRNIIGGTIEAAQSIGWDYYQDAILLTAAGSLPLRAARIFNGGRKLGRTHQYVLVFVKGEWQKANEACEVFDRNDYGLLEELDS